ncbi:antitoxin MazE-like protein, partial [Klebsiella sp. R2]
FDQARGNPEEAARILRCARLFARSEDAAQRLSELCNEAGSDATWRENIVEELQDREDLQAAEAAMEARRQAQLVAQADSADTALQTLMDEVAADTFGSLDEGYAAQAQAEAVKAWQGRQ